LPQRRIAPAVDQLVALREELHLANAAARALQVEAGADGRDLAMLGTDAAGQAPDLGNGAEIEAFAPDEGRIWARNCSPSATSPAAARG
jgi:hypothetical protein